MYTEDGLWIYIDCIYVNQALTIKNGWIRQKQSLATKNYHVTKCYKVACLGQHPTVAFCAHGTLSHKVSCLQN